MRKHRKRNLPEEIRRLIRRRWRQLRHRSAELQVELEQVIALTFLPNNHSNCFLDQWLRVAGSGVLAVLSTERGADRNGNRSWRTPLRGFHAKVSGSGFANYGGQLAFDYDGAVCPYVGARGKVIHPARNPRLISELARLDQGCLSAVDSGRRLPTMPRLPRFLLAFPPSQPPKFADTPALRRLAAEQLGVPVELLGANGQHLLDLLLKDVWRAQWIGPDDPDNTAGTLLIDAELCDPTERPLRVYEDYRHLLGAWNWNPARSVAPLTARNPASQVLPQYGLNDRTDFNQPLAHDLVLELERAMRHQLGQLAERFTTEEILDGVTAPAVPLIAWTPSLPQLRAKLGPYISECTTDEDLMRAARRPDEPLIASGACRVQVLRRRTGAAALHFAQVDLGRRIEARLAPPDALAQSMDGAGRAIAQPFLPPESEYPFLDGLPHRATIETARTNHAHC